MVKCILYIQILYIQIFCPFFTWVFFLITELKPAIFSKFYQHIFYKYSRPACVFPFISWVFFDGTNDFNYDEILFFLFWFEIFLVNIYLRSQTFFHLFPFRSFIALALIFNFIIYLEVMIVDCVK